MTGRIRPADGPHFDLRYFAVNRPFTYVKVTRAYSKGDVVRIEQAFRPLLICECASTQEAVQMLVTCGYVPRSKGARCWKLDIGHLDNLKQGKCAVVSEQGDPTWITGASDAPS